MSYLSTCPYYRAALAAAKNGDLTAASRLVCCSIATGEKAPSAKLLYFLLQKENAVGAKSLAELRELVHDRKYAKALRVSLPNTAKAHTIRGLLFARIGRRGAAAKEFSLALALDAGNDIAKRGLQSI